MSLTLAQASTIVDVALKKGRDNNLAPLTVAVLDAGGHLVAFKREDKSGLLRYDIAYGKAWGALGMGFGSRTLAGRAAKTPQFFTMLAAASGGRMVTNPGGVLIKDSRRQHRRRVRHFRRHLRQGRDVRHRRHRGGGPEGRSGQTERRNCMKIYSFWRSLATYRVRIALNLKGIVPDEVIDVNLMKGQQREAAFRAVNPMMAIPALVDGEGPALFELLAIIEYIDETHPNPPLLPKDPKGRARVRGLAQIVACDSHPLIVPRVREYLEHEFKLDEAARTKWCQHWHRAALTALEAFCRTRRPGATHTATRSRWPTSASPARRRARNSSRSTPRRSRPSPASSKTLSAIDAFARAHPLKQPGAPASNLSPRAGRGRAKRG